MSPTAPFKTVRVYAVAGEEFDKKADAQTRADELEGERVDAYRAGVAEVEGQRKRAAELLGRKVDDVALEIPAPPAPVEVATVERARAWIIQVETPHDAPAHVGGRYLEQADAERERDRLEGEGASPHWRGPRHTFTVVEEAIPLELAEQIVEQADEAAELERKAARA